MKTRFRDTVALSLLTLGVSISAAKAQPSEALGLNLQFGHGAASPAGQPRTLTSTGGTALAAGQYTVFNTRRFGQPQFLPVTGVNGVFPTAGAANQGIFIEPAQGASSFSDSLSFSSTVNLINQLQDELNNPGNSILDSTDGYNDSCFVQAPLGVASTGFAVGTVFQLCDSLDASLKLGGVTFRLTGAENNPNYTLAIPEVGYTFTTNLGSVGGNRSTAYDLITDHFLASGKETDVSKLLLGVQTLPARGALPTTGQFFAFSGSVSRTASQGLAAATFQKSFGFNSLAEIVGYGLVNRNATLADFGLTGFDYISDCFRSGATVIGHCDAVNANLTLLGVSATLNAVENNPDVTLAVPSVGYLRTTTGAVDRDSAIEQAADGIDEDTLGDIFAKMLAAYAATTPNDPLVGNPASLQGSAIRAMLTLDEPSDLLEERSTDGRQGDPSGWMIGGRVGRYSAQNSDASFVEGVVERSFRLGEGNRSLFKVAAPFNFTSYGDDNVQTAASARVAYEMPLIQGKWVIEPSAGAGYVFESDAFDSGALYFAGVSSRYKIAPVGRGHIVIGNAVGYTSTIQIESNGFKTPEIANTSFRNGLAYQVPIGERMFGRLGTLRASYTYTYLTGDDVFLDRYHDVSVSFGLGSREVSARQLGELMRVGVSTTLGKDYEAFSLNLGFRF